MLAKDYRDGSLDRFFESHSQKTNPQNTPTRDPSSPGCGLRIPNMHRLGCPRSAPHRSRSGPGILSPSHLDQSSPVIEPSASRSEPSGRLSEGIQTPTQPRIDFRRPSHARSNTATEQRPSRIASEGSGRQSNFQSPRRQSSRGQSSRRDRGHPSKA
jgi:hypothetical protein